MTYRGLPPLTVEIQTHGEEMLEGQGRHRCGQLPMSRVASRKQERQEMSFLQSSRRMWPGHAWISGFWPQDLEVTCLWCSCLSAVAGEARTLPMWRPASPSFCPWSSPFSNPDPFLGLQPCPSYLYGCGCGPGAARAWRRPCRMPCRCRAVCGCGYAS